MEKRGASSRPPGIGLPFRRASAAGTIEVTSAAGTKEWSGAWLAGVRFGSRNAHQQAQANHRNDRHLSNLLAFR
jgi:hypothetical protein